MIGKGEGKTRERKGIREGQDSKRQGTCEERRWEGEVNARDKTEKGEA